MAKSQKLISAAIVSQRFRNRMAGALFPGVRQFQRADFARRRDRTQVSLEYAGRLHFTQWRVTDAAKNVPAAIVACGHSEIAGKIFEMV